MRIHRTRNAYLTTLVCLLAAAGALVGLLVFLGQGQAKAALPSATGDLSVMKFSYGFGEAVAGKPISYTIFYSWDGDGSAPGVQVRDVFPAEVTITSISKNPTSQTGGALVWDLGTLESGYGGFGEIDILGVVKDNVAPGTIITNSVSISGDVTDTDPSNNSDQTLDEVKTEQPDLWLLKLGILEETDDYIWMETEEGLEITFDLMYLNWSSVDSPQTTLVDTLPDGLEYLSADPEPTSINGNVLTWELGKVSAFDSGDVYVRVRPTRSQDFTNQASITSSIGDRNEADNTDSFQFTVVPVMQPRVLRPFTKENTGEAIIIGSNYSFEGLARAGATVTLYEGPLDGCYDFETCGMVPLGSAVAGADRHWSLTPDSPLATDHDYPLYFRAEYNGFTSDTWWWDPLVVRVDPAFEQAGWDMNAFTVANGDQEVQPGALGGSVGTTPYQPMTITIRQKINTAVPGDPELAAYHDLKFVITGDSSEPYTVTVPVSEFRPVQAASSQDADQADTTVTYDLLYVQHGFAPGSRVEIYCLPIYWPDEPDENGYLIPLVGLVWTKCSEVLVDPAGYVYDIDAAGSEYPWPAVPPKDALLTNATVTATVRTGDDSWGPWDAEKTGQVNPQVTDRSTPDKISIPGYYAFYVPPGQYRVQASAPDCADYMSPILTVVDSPIFHNIGMHCGGQAQTWTGDLFIPLVVR